MFHIVSWCLTDLHFISTCSTHSITSQIFTLSSPYLYLIFTFLHRPLPPSPDGGWAMPRRDPRVARSRGEIRGGLDASKTSKTYRNVNVNHMEISWKYNGHILNHVVTAHFLLSLWLKKQVVWSKQLQKPITCLHTGRRSFLSRPSLANKRLDSCTVMSWRHSSGTYHQTWQQDLTRLECPVGRCPVEWKVRNCPQPNTSTLLSRGSKKKMWHILVTGIS